MARVRGPVAASLVGARLRAETVALIGWFGPRGLASVVFLLVAYDGLGPAHPDTRPLVQVVTWTVLLSVFIHGLSARPVGAFYARRLARAPARGWESGEGDEPRISRRHTLAGLPAHQRQHVGSVHTDGGPREEVDPAR